MAMVGNQTGDKGFAGKINPLGPLGCFQGTTMPNGRNGLPLNQNGHILLFRCVGAIKHTHMLQQDRNGSWCRFPLCGHDNRSAGSGQ